MLFLCFCLRSYLLSIYFLVNKNNNTYTKHVRKQYTYENRRCNSSNTSKYTYFGSYHTPQYTAAHLYKQIQGLRSRMFIYILRSIYTHEYPITSYDFRSLFHTYPLSQTCCSMDLTESSPASNASESCPPRMARYFITIFVVSVFPAPDSPLTFGRREKEKRKKRKKKVSESSENKIQIYHEHI